MAASIVSFGGSQNEGIETTNNGQKRQGGTKHEAEGAPDVENLLNVTSNELDCMLQYEQAVRDLSSSSSSNHERASSSSTSSLPNSFKSRSAKIADVVKCSRLFAGGGRLPEHAVRRWRMRRRQRRQSTAATTGGSGGDVEVGVQPITRPPPVAAPASCNYGMTVDPLIERNQDLGRVMVAATWSGLGGDVDVNLGRLSAPGVGGGCGRGDGAGQERSENGIVGEQLQGCEDVVTTNADNESDYLYGETHSISVLERLILTHPVWFLRGIYRTGAVHLLQGKEVGNFIIRQSSQPSTMAITVRLPDDKGPYVEHYLVEAIGNNKLRLEGSDFHFSAIPLLVAHYCQCCDELPVQLALPKSIMTAVTKQELSSLAHLGQEFWVSPLATSLPRNTPSPKKQLMPLPSEATTSVAPITRPQMITFAASSPVSPTSSVDSSPSALQRSVDGSIRKPPVPPPRWYSISPPAAASTTAAATTENANFTVTTTVTFHVNQLPSAPPAEDPPSSLMTIASIGRRKRRLSQPVPLPTVPCIDSPPGYHCSSVTDKASDYEDIWLHSPSSAMTPQHCDIDDGDRGGDQTQLPQSEEMQVMRALKALGLASSSTWNCANQTDQEKVLARNSQNQDVSLDQPTSDGDGAAADQPADPIKLQNPFYSQPVDSLEAVDGDDTSNSKFRITSSKNISTSLTDIHLVSTSDIIGGSSGGVLNGGFRSSSSHLATTKDVLTNLEFTLPVQTTPTVATLPRAATSSAYSAKGNAAKKPSLLQQFAEFPFDMYINSAATTLTKKSAANASNNNNSDAIKDTLWKLDSSWEWYSRQCRGSITSDSDSDGEGEMYAVENLDDDAITDDDDDDAAAEVLLQPQDSVEEQPVQLRSNMKFPNVLTSPTARPAGGYMTSVVTVEELLTRKQPQLKVPEIKPLTARNLLRVSEYENLSGAAEASEEAAAPPPPPAVISKLPDVELRATGTRLQPLPDVAQHQQRHQQQQHLSVKRKVPSETGSSATEFSEPWDSSRWEQLLMEAASIGTKQPTTMTSTTQAVQPEVVSKSAETEVSESTECDDADQEDVKRKSSTPPELELLAALNGVETDSQSTCTLNNDGSIDNADEQMSNALRHSIPALPCLLSLRRKDRHLGRPIRDYVLKMACDTKLIFGQHIENFIQCTLESHETDPHITMRNMRQFMSGMANFLVNSGEGQFSHLVQVERAKLKSNEFLNLDTILEGVLHRIVVRPLKRHLCQLFVREYTGNGAVSALSDGIKFARARCAEQLGLKSDLRPLQGPDIEAVKRYLVKLQRAYSPLKKLESLLTVISIIYHSILHDRGGLPQSVGADDFLPMLTYVLVHCGLIAAEIEAEYMWGLLHPSLLSGEGGYYLTTLSSAVHVLKHVQRCHSTNTAAATKRSTPLTVSESGFSTDDNADEVASTLCLSELDGFMKVFVPDEQNGSIISKTIPVRPNMTTKDICKMVAHRLSVSNPQDYALYKLANGEENILSDVACPWLVKLELINAGVDCVFAYKRTDAKIAWPVHFKKP